MVKTIRRQFLAFGAGLGLSAVSAPRVQGMSAHAPGSANIHIGLAAYSFRKHFKYMKGKQQKAASPSMDMIQFVEYCATHRCGAELTSYFFSPDLTPEDLLQLKQFAFRNGVAITGTAIGNNFTLGAGPQLDDQVRQARLWIDRAETMGAPHVRFFAGTRKQLEARPEAMPEAIAAIQGCVNYAAEKGVFVGVENHGQLTADQVLQIVNGVKRDGSVKSGWFGINLDTGNFISENPYADIEKCLPHAVNIQLKTRMKRPDGSAYDVDLKRLAKLIVDSGYRGNVILEFEEPDPFDEVPKWLDRLRQEFA